MTKKQIKQLVAFSYSPNASLNNKSVQEIASILKRHDLKQYVRALKLEEKSRRVTLVLPQISIYNSNKKYFDSLFENKTLVVNEDPTLLLGMKVIDNDIVYDMSLKHNLEKFAQDVALS